MVLNVQNSTGHKIHTGQREAIRRIMTHTQRVMSIDEIQLLLILNGWKFKSHNPHDSVKTSLKRSPDMMTIGLNRWILCGLHYDQAVIDLGKRTPPVVLHAKE